MSTYKLALGLSIVTLLLSAGCQAILPTAQILSQLGTESAVMMPPAAEEGEDAMTVVEATPTATAEPTEEPTEEPTAEPTEEPTEEPTVEPTEEPTVTPTVEPTAEPTEEPTEEPTAEPTEEPTEEPTAVVTEEPVDEPTAEPTEEPTEEPTAEPTEVPTEDTTAETASEDVPAIVDTATVLVRSLRIRSGPSTEFDVIGAAVAGDEFPVTGQALGCQWYQINHPELGTAWIGGGDLATVTGTCDAIPAVGDDVGATPVDPAAGAGDTTDTATDTTATDDSTDAATATPAPILQATPVPTTAPAAQPTAASEATVEPAPTVAPTTVPEPATTDPTDPFPVDKGCLLLQNQLGPELTFTFTSDDGSFTDTVQVTSDADYPYCLDPGSYRVTVDAPPPWADINEEFTIAAGDRFFFPIRPR